MTSLQESNQSGSFKPPLQPKVAIAQIPTRQSSRSLWADAIYRLLHNRAAILGAIIILLNVVIAIVAPSIAPRACRPC